MTSTTDPITTITPETSFITIDETKIAIHTWNNNNHNNNSNTKKATILIFHGFGAHGLYPTVKYAAQLLANTGQYKVIAPDLPGHGQSDGLKGYIESAQTLINIGVEIVKHYYNDNNNGGKFFLLGSSMGGTISLAVGQQLTAQEETEYKIDGIILLAPMLQLNVSMPARMFLKGITNIPVINALKLIPSNSTKSEKQYRDPTKRQECDNDQTTIKGNLCISSANACIDMTEIVQTMFTQIKQIPLLIMIGTEDVIVQNDGSHKLMEMASVKDKTLKSYPALHGILCESSPLIDTIQQDLLHWIQERTN